MPCPWRCTRWSHLYAKVTLVDAAERIYMYIGMEVRDMTNLRTAYRGLWLCISNCSQIQEIILKLGLIPESLLGDEISIYFSTSVSEGNPESHQKILLRKWKLVQCIYLLPIIARKHYEMPRSLGKEKHHILCPQ